MEIMREFEVRQAMITPRKVDHQQFLFLGGHTDDDAMAKLTAVLNANGYGLSIGTMTDSANYDPMMPSIRWDEQIAAGEVGEVTEVRRMESPDGSLKHHIKQGIRFAGNFVDDIQPIAIITPHPLDTHPDHVAAFQIGKAVAAGRMTHYTTDTIYGIGRDRSLLVPDLYIPLSPTQAAFENTIYEANKSQMTDSPDVQAVKDMAQRRGREVGVDYAAVVFEKTIVHNSPIRDIFSGAVLLR